MTSSTFCSSQLCGFLSVILPIFGGVFGLIALYLLVRFWKPISNAFSFVFSGKSSPTPDMSANHIDTGVNGMEMGVNGMEKGVNGMEKGVKSNAASAVGEPQTFVPNFFFLRQNSLNDEKKTANGVTITENGQVLKSCMKNQNATSGNEPVEGKRRISKTHPACSPTFETDPIDWGDLGIKLPKDKVPSTGGI